jgi:hypothetical protein
MAKRRSAGATKPEGILEKVRESRFFLARMADYERIPDLESFLFCLSAFLSAFRTIGNRLPGVAGKKYDKHARGKLKQSLETHPKIGFLFDVRDVEVHGDGTTIWPRFRIVGAGATQPGPLELHFFPRMASDVRVIGFHFEGHRQDQNLIEFCFDALKDFEDLIRKTIE